MIKTCIFTVIKDEQQYLDDFIKYHLNMGIDIYFFEDYGSKSHKKITDKYDNVYLYSIFDLYQTNEIEDIVRKRKEKTPCQTEFINRGLKFIHSLHKYDWCALIDVDEYITSTEPFPSLLSRYNDHQAILVYWKNYGPSGRIYKPKYDKPIYDVYTEECGYEQYSDMKLYKITKFIVNMNKWKPEHKYWIHCANVDFIKADGTYKRTEIVYEPLYLRHYITKSVEEFCWKVYCRGMHHNGHRQWKSLFEMCPDVKDKIDKNFLSYFENKYNVELPPLE